MKASTKRHLLGKYGEPDDISAAIAFLLSEESTLNNRAGDCGMGSLKINL